MIRNLLLASLTVLPFAVPAAVLTVDNQSSNAGVIVDKTLYPACTPHPGNNEWCLLPPGQKWLYTLPDSAIETLTFVSLEETPVQELKPGTQYIIGTHQRAYELLGSGGYNYIRHQLLSCNTLKKSGNSRISISIPGKFTETCAGPQDEYIRWVEKQNLDMRIDFDTTTGPKTATSHQ